MACDDTIASNNHSIPRREPKKARFRAKIGLILFRKAVVVTHGKIDGYEKRPPANWQLFSGASAKRFSEDSCSTNTQAWTWHPAGMLRRRS
jgi:hypothetical protein